MAIAIQSRMKLGRYCNHLRRKLGVCMFNLDVILIQLCLRDVKAFASDP